MKRNLQEQNWEVDTAQWGQGYGVNNPPSTQPRDRKESPFVPLARLAPPTPGFLQQLSAVNCLLHL